MQDISPFTQAISFQAHFSHNDVEYSVDVRVPDLTQNAPHCWGDWGPMYSFELESHQAVQIAYRSAERSLLSEYAIKPRVIELNSPMGAIEREKHPLRLEFLDAHRGLRFLASLDTEGKVDDVTIEPLHVELDLDGMIFPQAQYEPEVDDRAQLSA